MALSIAVLFKYRDNFNKFLVGAKRDFLSSFPAVISCLEDFVFQNYDRVCE